jgi:predicted GH43/DUF377 family glycosyl hydrolase
MKTPITRLNLRLNPDFKKVIARFFNTGNERSTQLIRRILSMSADEVNAVLTGVLSEFSNRYRDIQAIFLNHFALIEHLLTVEELDSISTEARLLLGSYFTMEYSIQAAALFNPSIVEDPDQSGTTEGELKVIISFRATGESHISSVIFKRGKLTPDGLLVLEKDGKFMSTGIVTQKNKDTKLVFKQHLIHVKLPSTIRKSILSQLQEPFSYQEMEIVLKNALLPIKSAIKRKNIKYEILSMVNTNYELRFDASTGISERVIFPVTFTEKNGIEDARFVKFTDEDGEVTYIATYTAYDGAFILPHLIRTKDFLQFKMSPLHGKSATNKNLALFPRKINGQFAMLSRIDGCNNYIMFSDDLHVWDTSEKLQEPSYPWEFVQVGNGGSPIETEAGWLIITHGVGPMRKYCLGASLFDINDPTREIGRLKQPMLVPNEDERDGYVPNVVYTCGAIIHNDWLFIPYAVSDFASSFLKIQLSSLLEEILSTG